MEYTGCYNSVMGIIKDGTSRFDETYKINEGKTDTLKSVCDTIDNFAKRIDCRFVDVNLDTNTKQLIVDVGCNEIVLGNTSNDLFFNLIQMVDSFFFSKTEKGGLCVSLVIDGIWEKVSE